MKYPRAAIPKFNFVNLGRLYSLKPNCGCSAILPSGTRVVFRARLENDNLAAHLALINTFLQDWTKSESKSFGLPAHTVLVHPYGHSASVNHVRLKVYSPASWIRNLNTDPSQSGRPFYARGSAYNFRIYPAENDVSNGIGNVTEFTERKRENRYYQQREFRLAGAIRNYRGAWRPNSPLSLRHPRSQDSDYHFWELRNLNELIHRRKTTIDLTRSTSENVNIRYFESKNIAALYIAPHADEEYTARLKKAIVTPSTSHSSLANDSKADASATEAGPSEIEEHSNSRLTEDNGLKAEDDPISTQIGFHPDNAQLAPLPFSANSSTTNSEAAGVRRQVAQFEVILEDMKKYFQVAKLEQRVAKLQLQLKRAQNKSLTDFGRPNFESTRPKINSIRSTSELDAKPSELPESAEAPEHIQRKTSRLLSRAMKPTNLNVEPFRALAPLALKFRNNLISGERLQATFQHPHQSIEEASSPLTRIIHSPTQIEQSEQRVERMKDELLKLFVEMEDNSAMAAVEVQVPRPLHTNIEVTEPDKDTGANAPVVTALNEENVAKPRLESSKSSQAWSKTFSNPSESDVTTAKPFPSTHNSRNSASPPTRQAVAEQNIEEEGVSRPWLLSWLISNTSRNTDPIGVSQADLPR